MLCLVLEFRSGAQDVCSIVRVCLELVGHTYAKHGRRGVLDDVTIPAVQHLALGFQTLFGPQDRNVASGPYYAYATLLLPVVLAMTMVPTDRLFDGPVQKGMTTVHRYISALKLRWSWTCVAAV